MENFERCLEFVVCSILISVATSVNVFLITRSDLVATISIWVVLLLCWAAEFLDTFYPGVKS